MQPWDWSSQLRGVPRVLRRPIRVWNMKITLENTYRQLYITTSQFRQRLTMQDLSQNRTYIAINDILLKPRFFGLHFRYRKYWCIFNHFYVIRPKATEFGEITRRLGLLRRSRSSKVTEFGTNRKHICDFLLVINNNFAPYLRYSVR